MKNAIKILSIAVTAAFVFAACSKDDDPSDNDLFLGKYEGNVGYINLEDSDENVDVDNGSVTVRKVGANYTFDFSDGIPTLGDITMKKGENNSIIIEDDSFGIISIDESNLNISYIREGRTWSANCTR